MGAFLHIWSIAPPTFFLGAACSVEIDIILKEVVLLNSENTITCTHETTSYLLLIAQKFTELLSDPEKIDTIAELRFKALRDLLAQLNSLQARSFHATLLCGIAEKKGNMVLNAKSKTELQSIMHPKAPYFNGRGFQSSQYLTPEEELICWSEASLRAPLNSAGYERFKLLFQEVLPKEAAELWGEAG